LIAKDDFRVEHLAIGIDVHLGRPRHARENIPSHEQGKSFITRFHGRQDPVGRDLTAVDPIWLLDEFPTHLPPPVHIAIHLLEKRLTFFQHVLRDRQSVDLVVNNNVKDHLVTFERRLTQFRASLEITRRNGLGLDYDGKNALRNHCPFGEINMARYEKWRPGCYPGRWPCAAIHVQCPQPFAAWRTLMSGLDMELASGMAAFEAKEFNRAKQFLSPLAEDGNPDAQHRMAIMYQNGLGLVKDEQRALRYMRMAAEQGHALAQHGLAFMYLYGECVEKDEMEAARLLRLAAGQGLAGSAMTLGMMYEQGQGVAKDPEQAQKWYKIAEECEA